MDLINLAKIKKGNKSKLSNGGWAYDAYPEIEKLDAKATITIADIKGPAVINSLHFTQHFVFTQGGLSDEKRKALGARGIILQIYFDGEEIPAVRAPLGDFFADGCCGKAQHFSNSFIEKAPESYNCYIPMPFKKSARVTLTNETDYNLHNYSFVEYESIPEWDDSYGYFHATWERFDFQLNTRTDRQFFKIDGCGHLIGRSYSICTNEPIFDNYSFVMEANNEFYIDGLSTPSINYLGTEDSFGLSWGFRENFSGQYCGINHLNLDFPLELSIYRFFDKNAIRFEKSLELRLNWIYEFKLWIDNFDGFERNLNKQNLEDKAYVDYATTYYWYQETVGYNHKPMPDLEQRIKPLLHYKT